MAIVGITMGDPFGVGPEIIIKLISDRTIFNHADPVVIGNAASLRVAATQLGLNIPINLLGSGFSDKDIIKGRLNVLDMKNVCISTDCHFSINRPNKIGGKASYEYIKKGVELALSKNIDALTTCPISKEAINLAGYHFAGHTEMLGNLTSTDNFAMMLVAGKIKVILITTHIALKDVSHLINKSSILRIIKLADRELSKWLNRKPKIAVAALNPHAGENGLFGIEESREIIPAIQEARLSMIDVNGPFPADSLFSEKKREGFDVIICMYHDQGLIPIKMAAFGKAVNVTLGLPFIRTSVDHGTAFDIAFKGVANYNSLYKAVLLAAKNSSAT